MKTYYSEFTDSAKGSAAFVSSAASTIIYLYRRSTTTLTGSDRPDADVVYTFATGNVDKSLVTNGWSVTMPTGTDTLYVTAATAYSNPSSPVDSVTIVTNQWGIPRSISQNTLQGTASKTVYVYRRNSVNTAPSVPGTTTYTVATDVLSGTLNGWAQQPSTNKAEGIYNFMTYATAFATGTTDTISGLEWATPILLSIDGEDGATGVSPITVTLSKPSVTVPTDSDGNNGIYTGTGTLINIYEGQTTLTYDGVGTSPSKWTVAAPVGTGLTPGTVSAGSGGSASVSTGSNLTADTGSVLYTITGKNSAGGAFTITATQNFAKVKGAIVDTLAPKPPAGLTLTSSSETLSGGNSIAKIKATWTAPTQNTDNSTLTDLSYYDVQIKSAESAIGEVEWVEYKTSTLSQEWRVPANSAYLIRVRAVDNSDNKSTFEYVGTDTSESLTLSGVTIGTGGSFTCSSTPLAVNQPVYLSGALGTATITGYSSPEAFYIKTTNGTTTFTLTETIGGATVSTTAGTIGSLVVSKRLSYVIATRDTVAPGIPTSPTATATFKTIYLEWTNPLDTDLAATNIYESSDNITYNLIATVPTSYLNVKGNYSRTGLTSNELRYYKFQSVDSSNNMSAQTTAISATTLKLASVDIADGILDSAAMYATNMKPVEVITGSTPPTTGNFEGRKIVLTGDNIQYRYSSGAWSKITVDADTITVGQIQAGRIAAGAVAADQIAANAVTTSKLLVTGSNLIANSDFGTGSFTNWRPFYSPSNSSVVNIANPGSYDGPVGSPTEYVAKFARTGTAIDISCFAAEKAYADVGASTDGIAVQGGEQYAVSIFAAKTAAYAASGFRIRVYYYKSDGTNTSNTTVTTITPTTSWVQYSGSFTVPADAIRAWAYVIVLGMTAGAIYWTNLKVLKKASSELIVDGAITTNSMLADTIDGDRIATNTLHADRIISTSLTADLIQVPATGGLNSSIVVAGTGTTIGAVTTGTAKYRTPGAPTNNPAPSGITITSNSNGTRNIRLDWSTYTQGTNQADLLMLFWSKTSTAPNINSSSVSFNVNTTGASYYIMEGVSPADTYSFGIAAARRTESGLEIGTIVAPTSTPQWVNVAATTPNFTANVAGTAAATVVGWATDPAARINVASTIIDPGKILITGTTTLADWKNGPSSTEINGGAIAADTITANKISVGSRGITITGIEFTASSSTSITWTAGVISYTNDGGNLATINIPAQITPVTRVASNTVYLYWIKATSIVNTTTTLGTATGSDRILLATWVASSTTVNANYGRTLINGSGIVTGTVNANVLEADSAIVNKIFLGSNNFILNGNAWTTGNKGLLTIKDSGGTIDIVKLGYLTSTTIGFELRNASNQLLLNSSTDVSSIDNGQTGINLANIQYSQFIQSTLPTLNYSASTSGYTSAIDATSPPIVGIGSVRLTTSNTGSSVAYAALGPTLTSYNIVLKPNSTYLLSAYVKSSTASVGGSLRFRLNDVGVDTTPVAFTTSATANTWTRVSGTFTTNSTTTSGIVRLANLTNNCSIWYSGIMVEEARGSSVTAPSPYNPPTVTGQITSANTSTYIASLRADVIQIDGVTLDTDGSGNLIIKSGGVNTTQITDYAATNPISAYTLADITCTYGTYTTIQSITVTSIGKPIILLVNYETSIGTGNVTTFALQIKRGSTVLDTANYVYAGGVADGRTFMLSDTPSAGTYTYTVAINPVNGGGGSFIARRRFLQALETRR